jgi:hypothetical protein
LVTLQTGTSLLACQDLLCTKGYGVRRTLEHAFRSFGLPLAIRTDNGIRFATTGMHGHYQLKELPTFPGAPLRIPNLLSGSGLRQSSPLRRKGREFLQPLEASFFLLRADYPPTDGLSIGCRLFLKEIAGGLMRLQ